MKVFRSGYLMPAINCCNSYVRKVISLTILYINHAPTFDNMVWSVYVLPLVLLLLGGGQVGGRAQVGGR